MLRLRTLAVALATAAAIGGASAAQAADLRRPVAPVRVIPVVQPWHGIYAGVLAGYGWGHLADHPEPFKPDGGVLGVEIGGNWQPHPNFVLGVQANVLSGHLKDSYLSGQIRQVEILPAYTLRGRLGFVHNVRTLFYITAGYASEEIEYTRINKNTGDIQQHGIRQHPGTVWGLGVEHLLHSRWSAKIEYLHLDLRGSSNVPTFDDIHDIKTDFLLIGLNFKLL
jgi:outer membrane immunogenic protein